MAKYMGEFAKKLESTGESPASTPCSATISETHPVQPQRGQLALLDEP